MRIYFVGGHATGKTAVCRYISKKYNIPMITEVARQVLAEMETPLERMRADIDLINEYQKTVFIRQIQAEKQHRDNFVSDRAFDAIAYSCEHAQNTHEIIALSEFKEYVEHLRNGVVFFIRPHESICACDGVRENPVWEGIVRIDGMIKMLLELFNVKYVPIHCLSMQERIAIVDYVLNLHM